MTDEAQFHSVEIKTITEDEGTPDAWKCVESVSFTCTAPEDADCRTYPRQEDGCDCEVWFWGEGDTEDDQGHPRVPGRPCWAAGFFDAGNTRYTGGDADDMRDDWAPIVDKKAAVVISFDGSDEVLEWVWAK